MAGNSCPGSYIQAPVIANVVVVDNGEAEHDGPEWATAQRHGGMRGVQVNKNGFLEVEGASIRRASLISLVYCSIFLTFEPCII